MAGEDKAFITAVRQMLCRVCATRPVQAHHSGPRAYGRRAHDRTAIPLCLQHHTDWHAASGHFKTWDKARRRAWTEEQIEAVQACVDGGDVPEWW